MDCSKAKCTADGRNSIGAGLDGKGSTKCPVSPLRCGGCGSAVSIDRDIDPAFGYSGTIDGVARDTVFLLATVQATVSVDSAAPVQSSFLLSRLSWMRFATGDGWRRRAITKLSLPKGTMSACALA